MVEERFLYQLNVNILMIVCSVVLMIDFFVVYIYLRGRWAPVCLFLYLFAYIAWLPGLCMFVCLIALVICCVFFVLCLFIWYVGGASTTGDRKIHSLIGLKLNQH